MQPLQGVPLKKIDSYSEIFEDHAISCGSSGDRIARHNLLRDAVFQTAATANLAPQKEERALLPGTDSRPRDILIPYWSQGHDLAIDVTVVNPLRLDLAARSAEKAGHGLQTPHNTNWRKYGEKCEEESLVFCPFDLDTFGAWHSRAVSETKKLGQALARSTG